MLGQCELLHECMYCKWSGWSHAGCAKLYQGEEGLYPVAHLMSRVMDGAHLFSGLYCTKCSFSQQNKNNTKWIVLIHKNLSEHTIPGT